MQLSKLAAALGPITGFFLWWYMFNRPYFEPPSSRPLYRCPSLTTWVVDIRDCPEPKVWTVDVTLRWIAWRLQQSR